MKKISVYLFCMALLVSLVAGSVFAGETLKKIEVTGKFIVGARQDTAPFGFCDKKGNCVGFSVMNLTDIWLARTILTSEILSIWC